MPRGKSIVNDKCKLCGKYGRLLYSHIIPEFAYKCIYDEDVKRFYAIPLDGETKVDILQKGHREHLLCQSCESKLSIYENYTKSLFYDCVATDPERSDKNSALCVDIDYSKFKMYQLSVLWRASVSSLELFSRVDLGPYEEEIREMILEENPGEPFEFPCIICAIIYKGKTFPIMWHPERLRSRQKTAYRFAYAGFAWHHFVTKRPILEQLRDCCINKNGEIRILKINAESFESIQDISAAFSKVKLPV